MNHPYQPVIGLEVHAELETQSKMFCGCAVVDSTMAEPNRHVCPVCLGMPGMLPTINAKAIEYGTRVALALNCEVQPFNVFARKNYFYPDLPKGYQISQYEYPLALHGWLDVETSTGTQRVRIRRVHLEEDTGKLTHIDGDNASLVDLNRAGVPLLEIVSEPDIHSVEVLKAFAEQLHAILRYLKVNSGDMEKGVIRFESNVSVRPLGSDVLNPRTEIKNLNSFRALTRGTEYEIARQSAIYDQAGTVRQQTMGWNETRQQTFAQRSKENAHDYRYFPEPDLPPVQIDPAWVAEIRAQLPELPAVKQARYQQLGLSAYDAGVLVAEPETAHYFDQALSALASTSVSAKSVANWLTGQVFALLNASGQNLASLKVPPAQLVALIGLVESGTININSGRDVLKKMFDTGESAQAIVTRDGLAQVSDSSLIARTIDQLIADSPNELKNYLAGKESLAQWFFGQVMKQLKGQANPQVIKAELTTALELRKKHAQES
jgi:aspartyl-tRNA(Asn)/glutamyl-tRNA(Gln) amidotransferase subunit B